MTLRALPASTGSLGLALVMSSTTPLILLDDSLIVKAASGSFCRAFGLTADAAIGRSMLDLGAGEWNIPQLRSLLQATAAGRAPIEAYEIDLIRAGKELRKLSLSAHLLIVPESEGIFIVLAVSDLTESHKAERVKDDLIRDKHVLMQELQHRVANSLQIIASVMLQSVRKVQSEEARSNLRDAHHRVMSLATLQRQLSQSSADEVAIGPYFTDLCDTIGASMIGDPSSIHLTVKADASVTDSEVSVSLGLIVTELVINCLKHAFPEGTTEGQILVSYTAQGTGWTLCVCDNGVGLPSDFDPAQAGLGTGIVHALAKQLDAKVSISHDEPGTCVTVARAAAAD